MKHTSTFVVRPSREEEAEERTGGAICIGSMGEGLLFCCAEASRLGTVIEPFLLLEQALRCGR